MKEVVAAAAAVLGSCLAAWAFDSTCYKKDGSLAEQSSLVICTCPPSPDELARIATICGAQVPADQIVCINDFQYTPGVIAPGMGETWAWINLERCGDNPVEDAVVNTLGVGCDPYHQVVTDPSVPGVTGDTIAERGICSPWNGVLGSQVTMLPLACGSGQSNVRCHTFAASGAQHYTCETNPGHEAIMHGLMAGVPATY